MTGNAALWLFLVEERGGGGRGVYKSLDFVLEIKIAKGKYFFLRNYECLPLYVELTNVKTKKYIAEVSPQ